MSTEAVEKPQKSLLDRNGVEHVPTAEYRALVKRVAPVLTLPEIAALVGDGIGTRTLTKYYGRELEVGRAKANAKVGLTLYEKATVAKDTAALIWWTRSRMRWRAATDLDPGGDGNPTPLRVQVVLVTPEGVTPVQPLRGRLIEESRDEADSEGPA